MRLENLFVVSIKVCSKKGRRKDRVSPTRLQEYDLQNHGYVTFKSDDERIDFKAEIRKYRKILTIQ